jgi:hypothetical protein
MKTYAVTIKATICKTIQVEADDIEEAIVDAHEQFTVADCNLYEDYDEETIKVEEVAA